MTDDRATPDLAAIRAEHVNISAKTTSARFYCGKCHERMLCKVLALCNALAAPAERLARLEEHILQHRFWPISGGKVCCECDRKAPAIADIRHAEGCGVAAVLGLVVEAPVGVAPPEQGGGT